MTSQADVAIRVHMPGAFARLGPELADAFVATDAGRGQHVEFAVFRPSGLLAQAILSLWKPPALGKELGRLGAQGVREHYSVSRMAARALEVYQSIAALQVYA